MTEQKIVRRVDHVGRILIPKSFRDALNLNGENVAVEFYLDGDKIVIKKYKPGCEMLQIK